MGMHAASKVIAVSNLTKNTIVKHYGVPSDKVEVVYNAVEHNGDGVCHIPAEKKDKIVLFLGRITMQKGPEYFLAAAKKVLQVIDNVKFIMAGSGDMMHQNYRACRIYGYRATKSSSPVFLAARTLTGHIKMADLYVMPSVSEPFGISSLEAMNRNVPVLMSKQSGIAEVVTHALKVDFWDIDEMANKMIAVLKRPPLKTTLGKNGFHESHKFNWEDSATKVKNIYEEVIEQSKRKEKTIMASVCFYFQVHQPQRLRHYTVFDHSDNYFDDYKNAEICRKVANKCYLPANRLMLELIRKTQGKI